MPAWVGCRASSTVAGIVNPVDPGRDLLALVANVVDVVVGLAVSADL
jgi:hypothetical protein